MGRTNTQHKDAIRLENLVIRVIGSGIIQPDGTNHGSQVKIANPSRLPVY